MTVKNEKDCLKRMISELVSCGIPVTGVYMPSEETDGGVEIDGTYVLHIAPYHDPQFLLDVVESPGEEIASFSDIGELLSFLMEVG